MTVFGAAIIVLKSIADKINFPSDGVRVRSKLVAQEFVFDSL
jgi:hypothetical protein